MSIGQTVLGRRHVDPSVTSTLSGLQVEGTFRTGTHLVTVDQPISTDDGNPRLAMYGSCLDPPKAEDFPDVVQSAYKHEKMPGVVVAAKSPDIVLRKGRPRRRIRVTNRGDRAVQVSLSSQTLYFAIPASSLTADRLAFPFH